MQIPRHIFKAYDIRGLVDKEITPDLAEAIGQAFATLRGQEVLEKTLKIAVGRDMRPSSEGLQERLIKGLTKSGADVIDIGLVSTPAFYFGVGYTRADGGVMVSASHNPAVYNGFKMTRAQAVPVSGETGIKALAELIERGEFGRGLKVGSVSALERIPTLAVETEMSLAGLGPVGKFRLVACSGNGMGAQYLDELFARLNLEVTRIHWELDGTFPNHQADPFKKENTRDLQDKVVELGADLGIATDGDGDRIFFVDNQGEVVEPAIVRGLLAQIMLRRHPGAAIAYDIRPGKVTEEMILEAGGKPLVTRVGHSLIKAEMHAAGAVFGGESSGHFYYAFPTGIYEGPVTAATQLLQELTRQATTLSELVRPYRRYAHSGEINFRVADKAAVLLAIKQKYTEGKINEIDGVTVTFPTFWFNVRPSNTEELVRLNLEAVDCDTMERERDEVAQVIQS